jgi:tetratricopeptide (TPR) repeat protein
LAGQASELYAETLKVLDLPGGEAAGAIAWVELGYSALAQGEIDRAGEYFDRAMASQSPQKLLQRPLMLAGKALVELARNRPDEAAPLVSEARQYAEARSMKHLYPAIWMAEAGVSAARGEADRALDHYARAESLAQEMGMRPTVWQARAGAAQVLTGCGRAAEAAARRSQARAMIAEIAGLFQDEETRTFFTESAETKIGG